MQATLSERNLIQLAINKEKTSLRSIVAPRCRQALRK